MAPSRSTTRLVALLIATASATVQSSSAPASTTLATSASNSASAGSSVTSASSPTTTKDVPLSLWSQADSLLSSYYPSTSISEVSSLTWPSTVVIAGSTYNVPSSSPTAHPTSTPSKSLEEASPTQTSSQASHKDPSEKGAMGDKKLGIILGVVIGCVAFAIMGVLFCCLWRRRKNTGSFFMNRRTPSALSRTLSGDSWRPRGANQRPDMGTVSYVSGPLSPWDAKHARMAVMPQRKQPTMNTHPAYLTNHSSGSTSEDNPFFTPQERSNAQLGHHELDAGHHHELEAGQIHQDQAELEHDEPSSRSRSSSSIRQSRPPTPFSPMVMLSMAGPSHLPQSHHQPFYQHQNHNPFSSPEDEEAEDVISPILPAKNPERRHSPMVHYPSWDEVNEFDFSGGGRRQPAEDGCDGWRPTRGASIYGRHELA